MRRWGQGWHRCQVSPPLPSSWGGALVRFLGSPEDQCPRLLGESQRWRQKISEGVGEIGLMVTPDLRCLVFAAREETLGYLGFH